jgi:hypothetical protein
LIAELFQVKIKTFDLPANDPAGGIHLTLEAETDNVGCSYSILISNPDFNDSPLKSVFNFQALGSKHMLPVS